MVNQLITNRDKSPESPRAELGSPSDSESARQPPMPDTPYKPYSETPALVRDCASLDSRIACRSQQMRTKRISKRLRMPSERTSPRKIENHAAAVALWFVYYNFCRVHFSSRVTPAMGAGVCDHISSIEERRDFFPKAAQSARRLTRSLS